MKQQERESFIIFKDWDSAIRKAPNDCQVELYHALFDFLSTGKKPTDLSWQADMFLSAIAKNIEKTLERYEARVENGKRGGRPTQKEETEQNQTQTEGNQTETQTNQAQIEDNQTGDFSEVSKPNLTEQKPNHNLNKPNNNLTQTEDNQTKPNNNQTKPNQNLNDYDYVYDNVYVNVFSQSQSIKSPARTREVLPKSEKLRNFWKSRFSDFWVFGITPERDKLGVEVIDTLIEALLQASSAKKLTYNKVKYGFVELMKYMLRLTDNDLGDTVWSLQTTEDIQSRPHYILGCLINRAQEAKGVFNVAKPIRDFEALLNEQAEHGKERP